LLNVGETPQRFVIPGRAEGRGPGIQMQALRPFLDSGFAVCDRAPE
jgi:hypothetical protein